MADSNPNPVYDDEHLSPEAENSAIEAEQRRLLAEAEHAQQLAGNTAQQPAGKTPEELKEKENELKQKLLDESWGKGAMAALESDPAKLAAAGLFVEGATPVGAMEMLKAKFGGKFKKRTAITSIVVTAAGVATIASFLTLLPDQLNTFMAQATDNARTLGKVSGDVNEESQTLTDEYVKEEVLPEKDVGKGIKICPPTNINRRCLAPMSGSSPLELAFQAFSQGNLEGKLAQRGIEFQKIGGQLYMRAPGLPTGGVNIEDFANGKVSSLSDMVKVKDSEAYYAFKDAYFGAIENITLADKVAAHLMYRRVATKYGVLRCVAPLACNQQLKVADSITNAKRAAQIFIAQRVLQPLNSNLGLLYSCVLNGGCEADKLTSTTPDGAEQTPFQSELQQNLQEFASKYGADTLASLSKKVSDILENGWQVAAIKSILSIALEKAGASVATTELSEKAVEGAVPIAGWANLAFNIIGQLKNLGPELTAMRYSIITAGSVAMYNLYQTTADESKAGKTEAGVVDSFSSTLDAGTLAGGYGANATATPVYNYFNPVDSSAAGSNSAGSALLQNILPSKAYADTFVMTHNSYVCDNGQPPGIKQVSCNEENPNGGVNLANDISNSIPQVVSDFASMWNNTIGQVFNWVFGTVGEIASHLPGVSDINAYVAQNADKVAQAAVKATAMPFSDHMDGGRTGALIYQGADVVANDVEHYDLGAAAEKPAQANADAAELAAEQREVFNRKPLFARLFSKTDPNSLVSHIALALPANYTIGLRNTLASVFSDPFGKLLHSFSAIFSSSKASAATSTGPNPFGITDYNISSSDSIFTTDQRSYWYQHCADGTADQNWNASAQLNPSNGQPENYTPNYCRFLQNATPMAAAALATGGS